MSNVLAANISDKGLCIAREGNDMFAQQLFGSPKTTSTDHFEAEKALKTVRIHPLSLFRKYWDFAVIICVIFSVVVLPFRAAFYWDTWDHGSNHGILLHQIRVRHAKAAHVVIS